MDDKNLFKCVRCKKFKPRKEFNDRYFEFGRDGVNFELCRKVYCKDCELPCDGGHERKKFSSPIKIKKEISITGRICKNCGEEYFVKGFSKYCRLCRTPSGRKKRKKLSTVLT